MDLTIDPLHPEILKMYRGAVHGGDFKGVVDIEFPSMHRATSWAETCGITHQVSLRIDTACRFFDKAVVVQLYPNAKKAAPATAATSSTE